ncbi:MAG: Imm26 family immunity protein [Anaerolineaceae bacterium]
MIKVGDVFVIPLSDGRMAYGQYVFKDIKNGPLISVFAKVTENVINDMKELVNTVPLFPPVITGLNAAIRSGMWQKIGKLPVNNFVYPEFVSSYWNDRTGEANSWFIWDGAVYTKIGPILPEELKNLEYLVVWSPFDIMFRIETGEYPYPYGDLIRCNKFTPRRDEKSK